VPWVIQNKVISTTTIDISNNIIINENIAENIYRRFCQQNVSKYVDKIHVIKYFCDDIDSFDTNKVKHKERILT